MSKQFSNPGSYYLYIAATLPDWANTIKVYYMSRGEASDAEVHLLGRCRLQPEEE